MEQIKNVFISIRKKNCTTNEILYLMKENPNEKKTVENGVENLTLKRYAIHTTDVNYLYILLLLSPGTSCVEKVLESSQIGASVCEKSD